MFSVRCWLLDVLIRMNLFQTSLILAFAFLAVFAQAALDAPRHLLGAQIDLLPGLMIFTALNAGLPAIALLAVFGGLWLDSLSANPLGISILPLLAIGWPIYLRRELISCEGLRSRRETLLRHDCLLLSRRRLRRERLLFRGHGPRATAAGRRAYRR